MTPELPSRDEVLSGSAHSSRRAARVLTAIELRVAYLRDQVRKAIAVHFLGREADASHDARLDYLRGLKLRAGSDASLTVRDLERYADQWRTLVPPSPQVRAGLINLLTQRYRLSRDAARTLDALGYDDPAVRASYQEIYGRSLDSLSTSGPPATPDGEGMAEIEDSLAFVHLPAGEVLFRQGEACNSLYVLLSGRLQLTTHGRDGVERVMATLGRGDMVGETSLLTNMPHTATAQAARDCELIEVPGPILERLMRTYPEVLIQLSRAVVRRIANQDERGTATRLATLAVVPVHGSCLGFGRRLAEALVAHGQVLYLDSARVRSLFGMDPSEAAADRVEDARLGAWLDAQEASSRYVLYEADPSPTPWTERCIRQADCTLLVGSAQQPPSLGPLDKRPGLDSSRVELVLLHPPGTVRPRDTHRWLMLHPFRTHHHVREGDSGSLQRVARRVTGQAVGLVLSGGGARGVAHAGVVQALEELEITIDMIGGTSMGSWMGALFALDRNFQSILEYCRAFGGRRQLLDFTLPITAFTAGRKLTDMFQRETDGASIEDLWRPFYCVSTSLTRAQEVIHREGSLWRSVRASTALPGIYPPLLENGEVLIDGGLMNNFPLDIMRDSGEVGTVIGVSVAPIVEEVPYQFGDSVSGWQILSDAVRRRSNTLRSPTLFATLVRGMTISSSNRMRNGEFLELADVLIQPSVERFGILDFDQYQPIIDAGYAAARSSLENWLRTGGDSS